MRVIFLDVDGVLNSVRTCVAVGGYPLELYQKGGFDWTAIKLLQRFCDSTGIQIVLSSTWRKFFSVKEVAECFGLPIIDKTPDITHGCRGDEIKYWLDNHPEVTKYAIIDDDGDMLEEQMAFFVQTDAWEGFLYKDFRQLGNIFDEDPMQGEPRNRDWKSKPSVV